VVTVKITVSYVLNTRTKNIDTSSSGFNKLLTFLYKLLRVIVSTAVAATVFKNVRPGNKDKRLVLRRSIILSMRRSQVQNKGPEPS
jgi:hypothetical protein